MSDVQAIEFPAFDDSRPFAVRVERLAGAVALTVEGDLDVATAPELRARLMKAIDAGATAFVIDLRGVTFMDSCGLAAVLHARARLADRGRFALVLASDSYAHLMLEVAGLPASLSLFETREAALAHVLAREP